MSERVNLPGRRVIEEDGSLGNMVVLTPGWEERDALQRRRVEDAEKALYRAMVELEKTSEAVPFSVGEDDLHGAIRVAWMIATHRSKGEWP